MNPAVPLLVALTCAICGCNGASAPPSSPSAPSPCSLDRLAAFQPGTSVVERRELPPMQQALEDQTTTVAAIPCQHEEEESDCLSRGEVELARQVPGASYRSQLLADESQIVVRLQVDGAPIEETFPSPAALQTRLAELARSGHDVELTRAEAVPLPDAKRYALVEAIAPARTNERVMLRMSLRIAPPRDPVGSLLRLQSRAAASGIVLLLIDPREDGSLEVEIGCAREEEAPARADGS